MFALSCRMGGGERTTGRMIFTSAGGFSLVSMSSSFSPEQTNYFILPLTLKHFFQYKIVNQSDLKF